MSYCVKCGTKINPEEKICGCGNVLIKEVKKSVTVFGILQILFGHLGIGRFALKNFFRGGLQLCITLFATSLIYLSFSPEFFAALFDDSAYLILYNHVNFDATLIIGTLLLTGNYFYALIDGIYIIVTQKTKPGKLGLGFLSLGGLLLVFNTLSLIVTLSSINIPTIVKIATDESFEIDGMVAFKYNCTIFNTYDVGNNTLSIGFTTKKNYSSVIFYAIDSYGTITVFERINNVESRTPYALNLEFPSSYLSYSIYAI